MAQLTKTKNRRAATHGYGWTDGASLSRPLTALFREAAPVWRTARVSVPEGQSFFSTSPGQPRSALLSICGGLSVHRIARSFRFPARCMLQHTPQRHCAACTPPPWKMCLDRRRAGALCAIPHRHALSPRVKAALPGCHAASCLLRAKFVSLLVALQGIVPWGAQRERVERMPGREGPSL